MLNKLEKKLGKYAINNLMMYIIAGYILGYLFKFGTAYTNLDIMSKLTLEPYYIIHGFQIWRIFTWILIPPNTSMIWVIFMLLLYYQLGNALERAWGAFRFNVYIFGGMLLTIVGAFAVYGYFALTTGSQVTGIGYFISTNYINLSIFLAFATCFPDMQVMLYFIIPIKMKWMAVVYGVIIGFDIIRSLISGQWYLAVPIVCSLLNFLIFFMSTRNYRRIDPREIHRKAEFKRQATPPPTHTRTGAPIARHKCAVCGRTELTNPELDFRFCSKCNGNYEYCQDHLFTHSHVN